MNSAPLSSANDVRDAAYHRNQVKSLCFLALLARQVPLPFLKGVERHYLMQDEDLSCPQEIEFCTGCFFVMRTEAFRRMGYRAEFTTIDWEKKTELVDSGEIDCIWDCFSMEGREDDYQWAGPYLVSRQVVAVDAQSGIETLSELEGKTIAVQATGKPEAIFLRGGADVPAFRNIISLADRGVQYAMLDCGYTDAIAAHEEAIRQYMKDYGANFRILDEPLLVTGIGVAFSKNDTRGLAAQLNEVFEQMREDGSMEKLVGKYLDDPAHSLEVDALEQ